MKTSRCKKCKAELHFEPVVYNGLEVGTPGYCDGCLKAQAHYDEVKEAEQRFTNRIDRSGLPSRFHGLRLPETELGAVAGKWAREETEKPGLCFAGPVGVGKTYLAAAACWERLRKKNCLWVPVAHLLTRLRGGFGDMRQAATEAVVGGGAIVLDDLDKANPTDYGREVIFAAVDSRIESGAPMLVTTNLGLEQVEAKLGEPIASRLLGHCEVIRISGEDRRAM